MEDLRPVQIDTNCHKDNTLICIGCGIPLTIISTYHDHHNLCCSCSDSTGKISHIPNFRDRQINSDFKVR